MGFFVSLEDFLNSYGDVKAKKNVLCLESLRLPPSVVQLLYRVLSNWHRGQTNKIIIMLITWGRFICLKCQSSSDFYFSVNNILYTGKGGFSYTSSLSYTFCCFTSAQEYFTHLEMSPLTTNGCKVRHLCICSVQPIIGRKGESLSYQEYFAHIEKYHHKPWRAAKLDLNVYLSTAFYRKGGGDFICNFWNQSLFRSYRDITIDHEGLQN